MRGPTLGRGSWDEEPSAEGGTHQGGSACATGGRCPEAARDGISQRRRLDNGAAAAGKSGRDVEGRVGGPAEVFG